MTFTSDAELSTGSEVWVYRGRVDVLPRFIWTSQIYLLYGLVDPVLIVYCPDIRGLIICRDTEINGYLTSSTTP